MNAIDLVGIISIFASVICSLIINNYYLFGVLYIFGAIVLLIGKCAVNETPKFRIFLPVFQLIIAFVAILYGSVEELNKCGLLYSVYLCCGGLSIIVGLKTPRIFIHRVIASTLSMLMFFAAFLCSYGVNMLSALISGLFSALVILFGIVLSDRNWFSHFMIKKP